MSQGQLPKVFPAFAREDVTQAEFEEKMKARGRENE
jgi:hypothetical protein